MERGNEIKIIAHYQTDCLQAAPDRCTPSQMLSNPSVQRNMGCAR